jgi:hypothetical protein
VSPSEGEGHRFESYRVRHFTIEESNFIVPATCVAGHAPTSDTPSRAEMFRIGSDQTML